MSAKFFLGLSWAVQITLNFLFFDSNSSDYLRETMFQAPLFFQLKPENFDVPCHYFRHFFEIPKNKWISIHSSPGIICIVWSNWIETKVMRVPTNQFITNFWLFFLAFSVEWRSQFDTKKKRIWHEYDGTDGRRLHATRALARPCSSLFTWYEFDARRLSSGRKSAVE